MQDIQNHTSPTVDNLPAARGILLAAAISSLIWLIIGAIAMVLF